MFVTGLQRVCNGLSHWHGRRGVGLDIGASAVRVVSLRSGRAGPRLEAHAWAAMPLDSADGSASALDAIRIALRDLPFRAVEVVVGLPGSTAITRRIVIPADDDGDAQRFDAAVQRQAAAVLPVSPAGLQLDWHRSGPADAIGHPVCLVAVRRETVDQRMALLNAVGLRAQVVDLNPYAERRALELWSPQHVRDVLIDCGQRATRVISPAESGVVTSRELAAAPSSVGALTQWLDELQVALSSLPARDDVRSTGIAVAGSAADPDRLAALQAGQPGCMFHVPQMPPDPGSVDAELGGAWLTAYGLALRGLS